MDSVQQHQRFLRPPPSLPEQAMPPPAAPPQGPWFAGQFQYQPPPPPHHPHHNQPMWPPPPPHSDHQPLPPPPHPPRHHPNYFPPHHMAPLPPPPQPYPHRPYPPPPLPSATVQSQNWGNPNWGHHQGWEHPDRNIPQNNEEEWAARARAWAAAKAAIENQHSQQQFPHHGGQEDHNHAYRGQYQQATDPHYTDIQIPSHSQSSHHQTPSSLMNSHGQSVNQLQETSSFSAGLPAASFGAGGHIPYTARDGAQVADSIPQYHHQGNFPANSSNYQQEVPSSYSSLSAGKEEAADPKELLHANSTLPVSSPPLDMQQHMQPAVNSGRSIHGEQPQFTYGNHFAESMIDPSDRPLEFAPGFNRGHDSHDQHPHATYRHPDSVGSMETIGSMPPIHAMPPQPVTGAVYPSIPSGLQFDPSFPTPVPGQTAPMFGQIPGPHYRPTIPPVGASYGLGTGSVLHFPAGFPGDANGFSNVTEQPKKASVPNWLREEIIKKAVNTSSSQVNSIRDPDDLSEEVGVEKSSIRAGRADNKSNDSSRTSDDEDEDEDEAEAKRTATINQEIKRVLTEVLLKVTDELFDEIATKVLTEDNLVVEAVDHIVPSDNKASPQPTTPKASAKVLIPVKTKDSEVDTGEQSSSGSPADLLGLASYASDDDDGDEIQSSSNPTTGQVDVSHLHSTDLKLPELVADTVENDNSYIGKEGTSYDQADDNGVIHKVSLGHKGINGGKLDQELNHDANFLPATVIEESRILDDEDNDIGGGKIEKVISSHLQKDFLHNNDDESSMSSQVSQGREMRSKSSRSDDSGSKRNFSSNESVRLSESGKVKPENRHSGLNESRRDEIHVGKDKTNVRNGSKERVKDRGTKLGEKPRELDSKRSFDRKDDKKDGEKGKRASGKDESSKKREHSRDEKEDDAREKHMRDSGSRHKRRRTPPTSGRARDSKDESISKQSSDDESENSRQRKLNSRKRSLSPSPTRTRRRHVSRSPHSKHSQRRHSPYSSLESTRGRRSRSKSPVRRRR